MGGISRAYAHEDDPPPETPTARGWRVWCEVLVAGGGEARAEEEAGVHQVVLACGLPATELAVRSFAGGEYRPRVDWLMDRARKHRARVLVGDRTEHDHSPPLTEAEQHEARAELDAPRAAPVDRGPPVAPSPKPTDITIAGPERFAQLAEAVGGFAQKARATSRNR